MIEKNEEIVRKLRGFSEKLFISEFSERKERKYRLSDICDFETGYSYTSEELKESKMGMVSIKCIGASSSFNSAGIKALQSRKKVPENKKCSIGDVLVAHTDLTKNQEIIGSPCLISSSTEFDSLCFTMDMVKVIPTDDNFNRALIFQILSSNLFHSYALGFCSGTTVVHLSKKALETYEFYGPEIITADIKSKLSNLQMLVIQAESKNRSLKAAKKVLLQKYFGSC